MMIATLSRRIALAGVLFHLCAIQGCGSNYSGTFLLINNSDKEVRDLSFTGFGSSEPRCGRLLQGKAGLAFPWMRSFPLSTVIKWRLDNTNEVLEQTLDLNDVRRAGAQGMTIFELSKDGSWSARFEAE